MEVSPELKRKPVLGTKSRGYVFSSNNMIIVIHPRNGQVITYMILICGYFAGKRGSGRGSVSDLEGSWTEESWTFTQTGPSSTKKLKKSRWKDESLPGLVLMCLPHAQSMHLHWGPLVATNHHYTKC